jgi:NAD(P)-dependent dehydrogenase (short-subunit alcohol dehydrogenase family)
MNGQTALVVGGARGIGYATARVLAGQGARLALADIDADAVVAVAQRLSAETGTQARGFGLDVTDFDRVRRVVTDVTDALGAPDIVVQSAAVLDDKLFVDSSPADWKRMIDVCLYGPMHVVHSVLPGMMERNYGRIICLASDAARIGQARLSYYAAAKAGVIALAKSVAQEVGRRGVTINIVSPGATNTELRQARESALREQMGEDKYAQRVRSVLRGYPTGRLGEPEDLAAVIAFLASRQASWVTGQVLSVNGGFVMP